jgi:hypothetical protein
MRRFPELCAAARRTSCCSSEYGGIRLSSEAKTLAMLARWPRDPGPHHLGVVLRPPPGPFERVFRRVDSFFQPVDLLLGERQHLINA